MTRIPAIILVASFALPAALMAAGSDSSTPPTPTNTTQTCENGQVWDTATETCVDVTDSRLQDDALYDAVREFAYAGQTINAQDALAAMSDQSEDRVLTYWGFTHRQLGNSDRAMAFYAHALATNPDNLLARSYFGQALVLAGDIAGARVQLAEIWDRGGAGGWPEHALHLALTSGQVATY